MSMFDKFKEQASRAAKGKHNPHQKTDTVTI